MTTYNPNSGIGLAENIRLNLALPVMGRLLIVCPSTDANFNKLSNIVKTDSEGVVRLYTTIAAAYDAATTNANDVIALSANSSHAVGTSGLTVSKNRIHFIGMDGGDHLVEPGVKIQASSAASTAAFVIKNTGVRNTFRNLRVIQTSTDALALTVFQDGGEGTVMKNVELMFGVVDNLDQTTAHEFVAGTDSGTFIDCKFGADTLLTSAARSILHIDQVTASQEFKSNFFRRCTFMVSSSSTGVLAIKMDAAGDILFSNLFEDCTFIASLDSAGGVACTRAVATANGTTKGTIYISYPRVFGFDDIGTNGTNNDNLYVFSHAPSAANITAAQPTTS
ncbi:MAG: hypothetical protein UT24_C0020G0002 [Candidatus Woesebacteria bacterium GW2011_GWB1_39_12]|uniref:Uncharacterized protein n=1 Tax=Candidatus Woesebacteria bacterium GW2011_GWB1_39_12 TaxID=1618574 RepID=A0A0G0PP49_9BACT|nr:MAG: hypothetical protein UT24_C0020G0002 [Candidatus Woesebacteria bacterium GW2011_GWB1_39_12]